MTNLLFHVSYVHGSVGVAKKLLSLSLFSLSLSGKAFETAASWAGLPAVCLALVLFLLCGIQVGTAQSQMTG